MGGFKYKIINLCKIYTAKQTVYERGEKLKNQKHKAKLINNIRNRFMLKKKEKEIKDTIITDI